MAEFQVELGFRIETDDGELVRDVDLLERFGLELEIVAGEMGPAAAIHEGRYVAALTVEAGTPLLAGRRAADVFIEAMDRALAARGDEIDRGAVDRYFDRLHVDATELVPA
jgi:hypothetical protein